VRAIGALEILSQGKPGLRSQGTVVVKRVFQDLNAIGQIIRFLDQHQASDVQQLADFREEGRVVPDGRVRVREGFR